MVKKIMKLISWLRNRGKYKDSKKINLSNIINYLGAEYQVWKHINKDEPTYISEQSLHRLNLVKEKSPQCWEKGECIHCGCSLVESTFGFKGCEHGCYPDRMSKKEWEQFKKKNKITLTLIN